MHCNCKHSYTVRCKISENLYDSQVAQQWVDSCCSLTINLFVFLQVKVGQIVFTKQASMLWLGQSELKDFLLFIMGKEIDYKNVFVQSSYFFIHSLSAGLFRQATYSTTRLGVYQSLFDRFSRYNHKYYPPLATALFNSIKTHICCNVPLSI